MRTTILVLTLALAAASFAALPAASASPVCTFKSADGCGGIACVDGVACASKDILDTCGYQSDCCSTTAGFWCPEDS